MSDETLIADLINAGLPAELVGRVANAIAAAVRNSTGIPVDKAAEKRRAYDRERKRRSTGIPPESTGIPNSALSIKEESKTKKDRQRGTRIPPEWSPSSEDRAFAEAQGIPTSEIDREGEKFRDFWNAKPGAAGVKLDWPATWRNWIRRVCEQRGFAPPTPTKPADSPEARGWRPGLPTDEELRANAKRRKAENVAGAEPGLLAESPGIRDQNGDGLVRDKAGDGRVRQLGRVLPQATLEAMGPQAIGTQQDRDFSSPGAMAGMVRDGADTDGIPAFLRRTA